MAMTQANKDKKLAQARSRVDAAVRAGRELRKKADAHERRAEATREYIAWLEQAPVSDPTPDPVIEKSIEGLRRELAPGPPASSDIFAKLW